jgi:hypothetical protein
MNNIVLTEKGAMEADGKPEYFLEEDAFNNILSNPECAIELYEILGSRNVCIGRVGLKNHDGVFEERKYEGSTVFTETGDKRGLGFYEKCD